MDSVLVQKPIQSKRKQITSQQRASALVLADIEKYNLCPIRYSKKGFIHKKDLNVLPYPSNPNGSINNIAGLCDTTGQVFGLMPHPEAFLYRFHHPRWRNEPLVHENALKIFRNAVNYIRS